MTKFAEKTKVAASKSRMEIENCVDRYGGTQFYSGWDTEEGVSIVGFSMEGRQIRMRIRAPELGELMEKESVHAGGGSYRTPTEREAREQQVKEAQRRWRALALVVKAKLEAVASGVETFEQAFLAHVLLPDGTTVGDFLEPQLAQVYSGKKMPKLLPGLGGTGK